MAIGGVEGRDEAGLFPLVEMAFPVLAEVRSFRPIASSEIICRLAFCCWSISDNRPEAGTGTMELGIPGRADSKSWVERATVRASSTSSLSSSAEETPALEVAERVERLLMVEVELGRKAVKSRPCPFARRRESRLRLPRVGREFVLVEEDEVSLWW